MGGLMEYEYMSILATKHLRPGDKVVDASLTQLHLPEGKVRDVLAVRRFDRAETNHEGKIHFEEFNQLLGKQNFARYNGAYVDVANVIRDKVGQEGVRQFYGRLLCQLLLGNTDSHLKNFAMFGNGHWSLTPEYDLAPSANYMLKGELALCIRGEQYGTADRSRATFKRQEYKYEYEKLNPKVLVMLGHDFGLTLDEIEATVKSILSNMEKAKQAVMSDPSEKLNCKLKDGKTTYRQDFCIRMDGRCKQLFGTMQRYLQIVRSKAPGNGHEAALG